jgi:hypothetical protein
LFEQLPEAGDLDKPKLVFFFDEAHLLFDDAPKALVGKVEQVVRLIRSKGVGVYFVTQSPLDIPDAVLGQLGNRVQHALRAFTPRDQKAVRAAAETFRASPGLDVATAITELAVGEALVSLLDSKGIPVPVERALIAPPVTRLGPITPEERAQVVASSPRAGVYEQRVDRESAYEILRGTAARRTDEAASAGTLGTGWSWSNPWGTAPADPAQTAGGGASVPASAPRPRGGIMDAMMGSTGPRGGRREGIVEVMAKSAMRSVGSQIGRQIARGILGGILGR